VRYLAVEVGYTDLGSPQAWDTNVREHYERVEVSIKGWNAYAVGIIPRSKKFDVFGKLGLIGWDLRVTSVRDHEVNFSESDSGSDPSYGIGLGWWVGRNITLRLEGESFTIGDHDDITAYFVGISYTF
jgi:hypothetical protein